jgi:hypothetical protein
MLSSEIVDEIRTQVRCGCYDKQGLMALFCEEMYQPGELSPNEVSAVLDRELHQFESEKASWPTVTDCDRLDRAFEAIGQRGIIALHNAGYTQSDGYEAVNEAYVDVEDEEQIIGYCFYHGQDLEHAVREGGLYLAFGPADPEDEEAQGPIVGRVICEELERAGLEVEWDGTFQQRIYLPKLRWQRR